MKRIIALLLLVMCSLNSTFSQNFQLLVGESQLENGGKEVKVLNNFIVNPMFCSWWNANVSCVLSVGHYTNANGKADEDCYLMLELVHKDLKPRLGSVSGVDICLSNGEKLNFMNDNLFDPIFDYDGDSLLISLCAWSTFFDGTGYSSSYRSSGMINTPAAASMYLFNQLSLYDIETIAINGGMPFKPQFKSANLIKAYVKELHTKSPAIKGLPDVNSLQRYGKKINVSIKENVKNGTIPLVVTSSTLNAPLSSEKTLKYHFEVSHYSETRSPVLAINSSGYKLPDIKTYWGKKIILLLRLSNGEELFSRAAVPQMTLLYNQCHLLVALDSFSTDENLTPRAVLQRLANNDIVEMRLVDHTNRIDLSKADGFSSNIFSAMCEALLEKTGAADLYALNTPAAAARPTTTPKPAAKPAQPAVRPTQPTPKPTPKPATQPTKSDAEAIAEADRRAVELMTQGQTQQTQKPTQPSTGESGGFLLKAQGKLKYSRYISRKDHIAPREMVHTPLALFTSRAIPLEVVVELVDGAKGVGKVQSSTSSDGKQKSVSLRPSEFYCRVSGFEEVPCVLMNVGYDAANTEQIKTSSFTYNLPSSWKRSKVKEYAKAFAEDLARLGVGWSESKDRYIGSYEGHYLMLDYGTNGQDNHIYLYISYTEK